MGWGSGSRLMSEFIRGINAQGMPIEQRKTAYRILIVAMQNRDWDTEFDCLGNDAAYDETLKNLHPDWFDEEREAAQ